jgi:NTP pyrophosphatase (non-canonical NTP hydrolase)
MNDKKLDSLLIKILEFREQRNWKQFHKPKDLAISLSLEASELLEHFQWKNDEQSDIHIKEKKTEIAEEMADIFYWLLLISNDLDIDLIKSLEDKIEKNAKKYPIEKSYGSAKKYNEL